MDFNIKYFCYFRNINIFASSFLMLFIFYMAIKFYSAKSFGRVLKVTIQKSGKLGFSGDTAKTMDLDTNTSFLIGKDDSINADLIMVKIKEPNPDAFQVKKSGQYFFLDTTALFDLLRYNYKSGSNIFFDVVRDTNYDQEAGGEVYLLTQRRSKGRKSAKSDAATKSDEPDIFASEENNQ